jgi:hypothetical protein
VIDDERVALERAEHALRAFEHGDDVRRVGDHRQDRARLPRDIGRRIGRLRAGGDELVDRAAAATVHDEREPAREKISRHGFPHDAETDKANAIAHGERAYSKTPGIVMIDAGRRPRGRSRV